MTAPSKRSNALRYMLLLTFIGVPAANFILSPLLSDGNQFSDDPETRIAAAGYAFAIWGVIFTGMLWFSAYLAFGKEPASTALRKAIGGLIVAGLASIAFVPISIFASATAGWIDIMFHLIPLAYSAYWLRRHVALHPTAAQSGWQRWSFFGPSMYLGWISAATAISTSLMAHELGVRLNEGVATSLTIAVLVSLAAIAVWMTAKRDPVYGLTICWALVAVGVKQTAYPFIQYTVWGMAGVVFIAVVICQFKRRGFYSVTVPH